MHVNSMKVGLVLGTFAMAMLMAASPAGADDAPGRTTFTEDVLTILQENCQTCHRPGGRNMSGMIAPMSLVTYQEVRPWAKSIASAVRSRQMPPWHASSEQHGVFSNERTLTEEQIATILAWVAQGSLQGDPRKAPEPVEWKEGWWMGEPDLIISFPEPFFVEDDVVDLYHNVTVKLTEEQLPEDAWVQMIEFRPGSEVVHHIIAYAANYSDEAREVDEDANLEEDEAFLSGGVMLGGLAPGTDPAYFPEGFGISLRKGAEVTFAMHYHKEGGPGTGKWDNSVMALRFTDTKPEHELRFTNIAHGAFEIPPNQSRWVVSGAQTFEKEVILINLMPHSHLRGVAAKYEAFYPNGEYELLLDVPKYDFNWQRYYVFKEPKLLPAGTRVEYEIVYDNSAENASRNGFNSNRSVRFGGPTTDEMDLGWYTFAYAEPEGEGTQ